MSATPNQPSDSSQYDRYRKWRLIIFGITWLSYAGFYLTRKSFSVAKIELSKETGIGLTDAQLSYIDGGYLIAYAVGQFVWGMMGDRFGTRKVILTGMFFSVLFAILTGLSTIVTVLGILLFCQGLCQSTGWAPLNKNMSNFFSQKERGRVMGLWCTNYAAGGMVASAYAGYAGEMLGYRYVFFVPAATLFCIFLLFYLFQRNRPEDLGLPPIEEYNNEPIAVLDEEETPEEEPEGSWKVILEVLTNPMVLTYAAIYFLLKPTRYAILLWGPKYLNEKLGTDMAESGLLSGLFEFAGPISVIFVGLLSDKLFRTKRSPACVIFLFLLAIPLFFIDKLEPTYFNLGLSLVFIGFFLFGPDAMISSTAAIDFGTKKGASTAAGLVNGCGSVGAILGGTLPGLVQDQWGWGWDEIFTLCSAFSVTAALLLLPTWNKLPPTAPKPKTKRPIQDQSPSPEIQFDSEQDEQDKAA